MNKKIKQYNKQQEQIDEISQKLKLSDRLLTDLIEYLERTSILKNDPQHIETWRGDLADLRYKEEQEHKISIAKGVLKTAGYIVVKTEADIDAAKLKKWVETK